MKATIFGFLVVLVTSGLVSVAAAQQDNQSPLERQKLKIAQAFCGTDGKIAECVGYPARECAELVKPFIATCVAEPRSTKFSVEDAFQRCVWREYMQKYGKQIDRSERCIKGDPSKGPLQPLPPHLDRQYELLNTPKPGDESGTNSADVQLFPEDEKR